MDFRSQSLSIAESNRTLELFSGGYSDTLVDKMVGAEVNTRGPGKKNAVVVGIEGKKALVSEVVVATPQVKPLVLIRVSTETYRIAAGEVFICLGQTVLRKRVDGSVKLSWGWEANGLASEIVEGLVEVVEAERLTVATEDRKIIMGKRRC